MRKLANSASVDGAKVRKILGENISGSEDAAKMMRELGFDAHHIVPWDQAEAKGLRQFMFDNGFTLEEIQVGAFNGVWLQGSTRAFGKLRGVIDDRLPEAWHRGGPDNSNKHTIETYNKILERIRKYAGDKDMIKEEIQTIGQEMQDGGFRNK